MREALFVVGGMTCSACVNTITTQALSLVGVKECTVSLVTNECFVKYDSDHCSTESIVETIEDCGFDCELVRDGDDQCLKQGVLTVHGMTCGSCVSTVTKQVESLAGVQRAVTALVTEECKVDFKPWEITLEKVKEAIEDCGFDAAIVSVSETDTLPNVKVTSFKVLAVSSTVEVAERAEQFRALAGNGILAADLLGTDTLQVRYDRDKIGIREVIHKIEDLGYDAVVSSALDNNAQLRLLSKVQEIHFWRSMCFKSCFFAIITMTLYMGLPMGAPGLVKNNKFPFNESFVKGLYYRDILGLPMATYVQFVLGFYFQKAFWKSLKHGSGTMDTLVCVSTSCAYFFSLYSILHSIVHPSENGELPNVIFDTSVMLIAFITLGKLLETKAKSATSTALSKLISLTPSSCTILQNGDLQEPLEIPIDLLEINDIVEVKPGMRIPSDGAIVRGETEVDESLMTGESLLVHKNIGSTVIGGSINGPGHFYYKATAVGDESKLSTIIQTMKQAQLTKAPIQRYADFLASIFVPSILCLALITFITWIILSKALKNSSLMMDSRNGMFYECFQRAISVVIVACPCALGLAAPTAIMVGTGLGAQHQVLIKGGDVLERFNNVGAFVFDKTGTLTTGRMSVKQFSPIGKVSDEMMACIRASERISEHPVAMAIAGYCEEHLSRENHLVANVLQSTIHMGKGLTCECEMSGIKYRVTVGNKSLVSEESEQFSFPEAEEESGCTLSYVCINGQVVGRFELSDAIRKDAYNTIQYLKSKGIETFLVTGDTHISAVKVAHEVGMPMNNIYSEVSPSGKSEVVEQLKVDLGQSIVFVGDGINDSPALVTSDVGIAISTGTDIAVEAADIVVLCGGNESKATLRGLIDAFDISRSTFRRVKLNLFWALCYNTFMIPIAMGFLVPWGIALHPMAAGLAMVLSSVSVVMSSLALKRWKPVNLDAFEESNYNNSGHSWLRPFSKSHRLPVNEDIELQSRLLH